MRTATLALPVQSCSRCASSGSLPRARLSFPFRKTTLGSRKKWSRRAARLDPSSANDGREGVQLAATAQSVASPEIAHSIQFVDGAPVMLHETGCAASCVENQGHETPELNDQMFLQHRGFRLVRQDPLSRLFADAAGFGAGGGTTVWARGTRRGGLQS